MCTIEGKKSRNKEGEVREREEYSEKLLEERETKSLRLNTETHR